MFATYMEGKMQEEVKRRTVLRSASSYHKLWSVSYRSSLKLSFFFRHIKSYDSHLIELLEIGSVRTRIEAWVENLPENESSIGADRTTSWLSETSERSLRRKKQGGRREGGFQIGKEVLSILILL